MFKAPEPTATATAPEPVGDANNLVPSAENTPVSVQPNAESPIADYAKVWETELTGNKATQAIALNQDELAKIANNMDFNAGVSPEDLAAVAQGGEASIAALQSIMNQVGRNAFSNALQGSASLTNSAAVNTQNQMTSQLPDQLKALTASNNLRAANSNLNDPAVAPMVAMIEQQLLATYPTATAQELEQMTSNYLTQFSAAVSPKPAQAATNELPADQNFANFL